MSMTEARSKHQQLEESNALTRRCTLGLVAPWEATKRDNTILNVEGEFNILAVWPWPHPQLQPLRGDQSLQQGPTRPCGATGPPRSTLSLSTSLMTISLPMAASTRWLKMSRPTPPSAQRAPHLQQLQPGATKGRNDIENKLLINDWEDTFQHRRDQTWKGYIHCRTTDLNYK